MSAVKRVPLSEFVKGRSQAEAGILLGGLSQAAISKMLRKGRSVFVEKQSDGTYRAVEEKVVSRPAHDGDENTAQH